MGGTVQLRINLIRALVTVTYMVQRLYQHNYSTLHSDQKQYGTSSYELNQRYVYSEQRGRTLYQHNPSPFTVTCMIQRRMEIIQAHFTVTLMA